MIEEDVINYPTLTVDNIQSMYTNSILSSIKEWKDTLEIKENDLVLSYIRLQSNHCYNNHLIDLYNNDDIVRLLNDNLSLISYVNNLFNDAVFIYKYTIWINLDIAESGCLSFKINEGGLDFINGKEF